jgi:GlpG protein
MIGHVVNEAHARTFSDYLYVQGIENQIEPDRGGPFAIWVHNEDEVEKARGLLHSFARDPQSSVFRQAADLAAKQRKENAVAEKAAAKRTFDANDLFGSRLIWGMGRLTAGLVAVSVVIWLGMVIMEDKRIFRYLFIDDFDVGGGFSNRWRHGLVAIKQGQIWRLVTPIFMHDVHSFLHILFNMMCLRFFGTAIELRRSWKYLLAMVLVIGAVSNLAQYLWDGPAFYGMSGVVYGLFGFIWMKSQFHPESGFFVHPTNVAILLIWLVLGFTKILPIANAAHTAGLLAGMAWGLISSYARR